ncbi:amino acid deaminase [Cellvibrio sp. QJXJ]|uniref:amino acid deaminase n=1 Tax=Cellvibrio sp. QJXJ TaxID=2964606 RepID=UPI0021C2B9ED|nr:amino acid deaminase [Cellvibrio sp. QJXJ]UUA71260.1 amino acid deaminase [Cellvibrio sp. QJXJ]
MTKENNLQSNLKIRPLSPVGKGLGIAAGDSLTQPLVGEIAAQGWNLLREDVSLPVAVLSESRLQHNLQWMKDFIASYGLKLAPHGKTTMSPALFQRQLDNGAWGITLATAPQVQAAYHFGVRRVILANQLVGRANMAIISRLLQDPDFECYVIVDSAANVEQLGQFFRESGQCLPLLLELGVDGGRTGVRDAESRAAVLEAINRFPTSLALRGIEVYEGVLKTEAEIRDFLRLALRELMALEAHGQLAAGAAILTGAGSAWFDLVAEEWAGASLGNARVLDIILRPGCYLTHDVGIYKASEARIQACNPIARAMHSSLLPALQLWAYVQSIPEPGLVILGLGKRDAAFDAGLPIPALHFRPHNKGRPGDEKPAPAPADWQLTKMMDQHAFMQVSAGADLQVGDMLALDISHPCLTFDKWRQLLVVDDNYTVIDAVETFF